MAAFALAAFASSAVCLGTPRTAHAEDVSPDVKGIVGGALLGAEVVVFAEALIGVRSGAAYALGAGGGAVAGGVGGYFVEQSVSDGRIPAYMLAGGLVLVIPALVVALDQTRFLPAEGARGDRPTPNMPAADPGTPGGSAVITEQAPAAPKPTVPPAAAPAPPATSGGAGSGGTPSSATNSRSPARASTSLSLFSVREGSFRVGVPVPEVRPVFTASQKKALGVEGAGSEVRFPLVGVTF